MKNDENKKLIQEFWDDFELNQEKLFSLESISTSDRNLLLKKLIKRLKLINKDLTLEIGPLHDDRRELTLSADGIEDAFPYIEEIYKNKPKFNNWIFHRFRQPIANIADFSITIDDINIKFSAVQFGLVEDEGGIVVLLFIPGYKGDISAYETIKFLTLDSCLGEYVAVKNVKYCAAYDVNGYRDKDLKPIKLLKKDFDKMYSSISKLDYL
ncbi:MAG: hypothetical protein K2X02_08420 [Alphaproteobacteria bacterium]|nr:hypothetical protein [Alphaproteobacteria bacterium]